MANLNDLLVPFKRALDEDSVMIDANHLGATDRVHKDGFRPPNAPLPLIVLSARFEDEETEQGIFDRYRVTAMLYMQRDSDFTFDMDRAVRIKVREKQLLDGKSDLDGTVNGAVIKMIRLITNTEVLPIDPQDEGVVAVRTQYEARIGNNASS